MSSSLSLCALHVGMLCSSVNYAPHRVHAQHTRLPPRPSPRLPPRPSPLFPEQERETHPRPFSCDSRGCDENAILSVTLIIAASTSGGKEVSVGVSESRRSSCSSTAFPSPASPLSSLRMRSRRVVASPK